MKQRITPFLVAMLLFCVTELSAGTCTGSANCTACSNCSRCKNCSRNGGTCGVCERTRGTTYAMRSNHGSSFLADNWAWLATGVIILFLWKDRKKRE
jgi:hypothetical protein